MEAAVASVAVNDVGAYPAAHRIRCFEYHDVDAGAGQPLSASQASQSRADDDDVGRVDQARPFERVGIRWSSAGHADAVIVAPHALSASCPGTGELTGWLLTSLAAHVGTKVVESGNESPRICVISDDFCPGITK